ncbi:hypothetical protein G6F56_008659 [Rhizopus delemar]|nr:hypothetical protein G6F56_008659 [Rhizopus delemar]
MDEMHEIDIKLDDSSNSESEASSQNDLDYSPDTISEPPRSIRRITRSRRVVVVLESQEVEKRIDDLHRMSSIALSERNIDEYRIITSLILQILEDETTNE